LPYCPGTLTLKLEQDEHRGKESDLRKDKRSLKIQLKELELSHEDVIKNLKKVSSLKVLCCVNVLELSHEDVIKNLKKVSSLKVLCCVNVMAAFCSRRLILLSQSNNLIRYWALKLEVPLKESVF
jgi:hypothetical protein